MEGPPPAPASMSCWPCCFCVRPCFSCSTATAAFQAWRRGFRSPWWWACWPLPLLVQLVDGGTADTLKNELSFGLRRGTVYWGKLCAALLLGLAFCLVLVGGSLAGRVLVPAPGGAGRRPWRGWLWWDSACRGPAYLVRHVCPVPYVGPGGAQSGRLDRRVLPDVFHGTAGAGVSGDSVVRRVRGVCAVHPVHCGCAALFAADARTAGWLAHRPVPALVLGPSAWDGWRPARGWGCFCLAGETFAREEVSAC